MKVTSIVQEAFAASVLPQVVVCLKSAAFVPDSVIGDDASVSTALPVFLSVIVLAELAAP